MNYKNSVILSAHDDRDKIYAHTGLTPDDVNLGYGLGEVRDQLDQGACMAVSSAQCIDLHKYELSGGRIKRQYSAQMIYDLRENKRSEGMSPRDAMHILAKKGTVLETSYPYGHRKRNIPRSLIVSARRQRIDTYARIKTVGALRFALATKHIVCIVLPVYSYGSHFWRPTSTFEGYHAVIAIGYNPQGIIIRNSWGKSWGTMGHVILPWDEFEAICEMWVTYDENDNK